MQLTTCGYVCVALATLLDSHIICWCCSNYNVPIHIDPTNHPHLTLFSHSLCPSFLDCTCCMLSFVVPHTVLNYLLSSPNNNLNIYQHAFLTNAVLTVRNGTNVSHRWVFLHLLTPSGRVGAPFALQNSF